MQKFDVVIIGGGAAGLACAVKFKKLNGSLSVMIVEAGERLGKKIAASGNGQGNISNKDLSAAHYHGTFAPFAEKLISGGEYSAEKFFDFPLFCDEAGRIYPAGRQASAVCDFFIHEIKKLDIAVALSKRVVSINKNLEISCSDGEKFFARRVLLCAGGKAQKQFNTDGSGYKLASLVGHSHMPLYPSLVQLKCAQNVKPLRGIRAECGLTVCCGGKELTKTRGDVIFTDYGISGNAVFYASSYCTDRQNVQVVLEFLPDIPKDRIEEYVLRRIQGGYEPAELLGGTLHNSLARYIMRGCTPNAEEIANAVKSFKLDIVGSLGWNYAQVTKGGIPQAEVGEDLQSKLVKGLYFAGEILDLDGDCGGYNLHFAFASGVHAAIKIEESLKND